MYTACCLSNRKNSKSGFETEDDAEKYIENFLCKNCLQDLKRGYHRAEVDGEIYEDLIPRASYTDCGAEWLLMRDDEYENANSIEDLFLAGGLVPNEKTFEQMDIDMKCKVINKIEELNN
jgi:hypothetical protein